MSRVLIVADRDPTGDLAHTSLWRQGVERRWISDPGAAVQIARLMQPRLVVVDVEDRAAALVLVKELRADRGTRPTAIAVLDRTGSAEQERALDAAGANVVLPGAVEPALWNRRLQELVDVPWRRGSRIPVRIAVWSRFSPEDPVVEGLALNISVRGMLLETGDPIDLQTRADFSFILPEDERRIQTVGQVVRLVPDGDRHHAGIEFQVLRGDARQRISAFVASAIDAVADGAAHAEAVDEGQAWEAELRASEARKAAILDSALDCIITFDHEGRIREFNRVAERTFGLRGSDVLGRKMVKGLLPAALRREIDRQLSHVTSTRENPGVTLIDTTARRADGSEFPVEASVSPAFAKGRLLVTTYIRDVTERRRAEAALRESEARHRAVSTLAWDYAYSFAVDGDGRLALEWITGAFAPITGYVLEELAGMGPVELAHPEDRPLVRERLRALVEGRAQVTDYRILTKQGRVRWIRDHARPAREGGRVVRIAGAALDVTESKQADLRLRQQEEWLRALFENSSDGLTLVDADRRTLYRGPANARILGFGDDEAKELPHHHRAHPDDRAAVEQAFETALARPRTPITFECRAQHEDGSWRWIEVTYNNLLELPSVGAVVVNFRDIGARKEKEQEQARLRASIQASAQQWRQTVDSLQSAVVIVDSAGCVVRANRSARDLTGLSFAELKGRSLDSFAGREPWGALRAVAKEVAGRGSTIIREIQDPSSKTHWAITGNPVMHAAGEEPQVVLVARDVTRMAELQERVRRSELMSAMGSLVAGVAHEVRSPLFGITATLDAYERRYGDREENRRFLATIRRELARMSYLMEELLDYGRSSAESKEPGRIASVIEQAVRTCRGTAGEAGVELVVRLPRQLPPVAMDRRLGQVFHNLILNAIQHSPRGGTVWIEAAESAGPGSVECRVSDEGPGLPAGELDHLFDPFFTRRRGGTGLGLSIVRRIVEDHGGEILPGSREGGGALMTVRLPVAGGEP